MADKLYGLTEADVAKLRGVIAAWDRFGPAAFRPESQRRFYVDRRIKGQLTATLDSTDTSCTIDHVRLICGVSPTTSSTATVTIYNPDGASGANNDWVRAEWVISSTRGSTSVQGAWELIKGGGGGGGDFDVRWNSTAHKLQKQDGSTTWTDILTATNVTPVMTVTWTSTSHKLQRSNKSMYVFSASTSSSNTDIDTAACATACT